MRAYRKSADTLDPETVRAVWSYDPDTGEFFWNIAMRGLAKGTVAGKTQPDGSRIITYRGRAYQAARLAWAYVYGRQPEGHVVPINGIKSDTRIANLREQPRSATVHASKVRTTNKSGHRGVSWNARQKKWVASITRNYRRVHLGFFDTVEAAASAVSEVQIHGLPANRGSLLPRDPGATPRKRWISRRGALANPALVGFADGGSLLAEIGEQPTENHVISRIVLDRPLGPGNVEWRLPWAKGGEKRNYHHSLLGLSDAVAAGVRAMYNNTCAICGRREQRVDHRTGQVNELVIDHDHDTNLVRGALCNDCNRALGLLGESYDRLLKAAEYLRFGQFEVSRALKICACCQKPFDKKPERIAIDADGEVLGEVCAACEPRLGALYESRPAFKLGDPVVTHSPWGKRPAAAYIERHARGEDK